MTGCGVCRGQHKLNSSLADYEPWTLDLSKLAELIDLRAGVSGGHFPRLKQCQKPERGRSTRHVLPACVVSRVKRATFLEGARAILTPSAKLPWRITLTPNTQASYPLKSPKALERASEAGSRLLRDGESTVDTARGRMISRNDSATSARMSWRCNLD
jgi:hypothetical protein